MVDRELTRKERQPVVRAAMIEAMRLLGTIDEPTKKEVYEQLTRAGVGGDDIDKAGALRKLHSLGVVRCTHPVPFVGKEYMRRHIVEFNGNTN